MFSPRGTEGLRDVLASGGPRLTTHVLPLRYDRFGTRPGGELMRHRAGTTVAGTAAIDLARSAAGRSRTYRPKRAPECGAVCRTMRHR